MKHAFTLAEVLLTLAIIGAIAALTIPAVITKVTQDRYVIGLKKAYNTLKTVQRGAQMEHGPMEYWNWTAGSKVTFERYFKPHFDILKDCGATTDTECFHSANKSKLLNGDNNGADYNTGFSYNFITSDGIAYSYYSSSDSYPRRAGFFMVDVNGKKGPNTMGRDIFEFDIFRKAGIKPSGSLNNNDETKSVPSADVNGKCNTNAGGWTCAARVLSEGAMNY